MSNVFAALAYRESGLSLAPILTDGSKSAAMAWKPLQGRLPTEAEVRSWCRRGLGLAIIGGHVSGNLEILDFDAPEVFAPWCDMVEELCPDLVQRLPLVCTPSDGRHVYYRCPVIAGNMKLAQSLDARGKVEPRIETRGSGGYVLSPLCPPACHPLHKPYVLLDGDLTDIPRISVDERTFLLNAARSFNAYVPPECTIRDHETGHTAVLDGDRPGDRYAAQTTWVDILEPHGWTCIRQRGDVVLWKRPGKRERGWSATTGYAGSDLLYVFSVNAAPFESQRAYSKFAAYALLEHAGDFTAAAKALAAAGYGDRHAPQKSGLRTISAAQVLARGGLRTIPAKEVLAWPR